MEALPLPPRYLARTDVYFACRHSGCSCEFHSVDLSPRAPRWAGDPVGWLAPCGHDQVVHHPQAKPFLAPCDCCGKAAPLTKMLRDRDDALTCPECLVRPALLCLIAEIRDGKAGA